MSRESTIRARDRAAVAVLERIRRDRQTAPRALGRVLAYLEEHLFETDLSVQRALRGAGVRDQNVAGPVARKHLDVTLKTYIRTRQIETEVAIRAAGLEAPTGEVATAVGLPLYATYCTWHTRVTGSRPVLFHRPDTLEPDFNYATLNRALRGTLPGADAQTLLDRPPPEEDASAPDDPPEAPTPLELARDEALRKIRSDAEGLPPPLKEVLVTLGDHLFQPVNVETLLSRAGITDTRIHHEFLFHLGETPKTYLEKRLVESAFVVLGETGRLVEEVAADVGVPCVRTFASMFKRRAGERPSDVRRLPPGSGDPVDPETWSRYGRAQATPEEAVRVRALLRRLVPRIEPIVVDGAALTERRYVEEKIWPALRDLSFEEVKKEVPRYVFVYAPTALSDLLRKKSREEGRRDRQRGIDWAAAALLSLDANAERLGERVHEEKALGWAWLANAYRLDLDFLGAEKAFDEALRESSGCGHGKDVVLAKIWDLKGSLRLFQRRHKEAFNLFSDSLEVFESIDDKQAMVRTFLKRAAALKYEDQPESAALDLEIACNLVDGKSDATLTCDIYRDLAVVSARSGRFDKASAAMAACENYLRLSEDPLSPHLFQWAKGFIDQCLEHYAAAKASYLVALEGFDDLAQPFYRAFVALDLAIVSSSLEQSDDAAKYSSGVVPFFNALNLGEKTLSALLIVKDAVARGAVTGTVLLEFRAALWRDPLCSSPSGPGRSCHPDPLKISRRGQRIGESLL